MIYPPFAAPLDFLMALTPEGKKTEQWYIFSKDLLLIKAEDNSLPERPPFLLQEDLYMGMHHNRHLYVGEITDPQLPHEGWIWRDLRTLYDIVPRYTSAIAGRALQLIDWSRTNKYCGCCGSPTFHRSHERCKECPSCHHLSYPKLAPAILALIKKENQILLARSPHFPNQMYSALAGYVDPGETLEQCVTREVFEEVGLKVNNIHYFGSQPWPFSKSLMIAFCCDWEEGEITIDPVEIEAAAWFNKTKLPTLPPPLSISRMLIEDTLGKM